MTEDQTPTQTRVQQFVHNVLHAPALDREEAVYELMDAVKSLECEAGAPLAPVERALPQLAEFLLDAENGNVNGCAISLFRRVRISRETIVRWLALNQRGPDHLVIEALGKSDPDDWTTEVEPALAGALAHEESEGAAVYAIYSHYFAIKRVETVRALVATTRSQDGLNQSRAVAALARLTTGGHGQVALELLANFWAHADTAQRTNLAEILGWATDCGLPLLRKAAEDPDPKVRAAAAKALGRGYLEDTNGRALLQSLRHDSDAPVREAAREAWEQGSG